VSGVHAPHAWVVASQLCPAGHVPQLTAWPHSFSRTPHVAPRSAHVFAGVTHCFVVLSQMWVASHVPHWSVAPQPSSYPPHVAPSDAHVAHADAASPPSQWPPSHVLPEDPPSEPEAEPLPASEPEPLPVPEPDPASLPVVVFMLAPEPLPGFEPDVLPESCPGCVAS
jgi:hypothetical protein